MIGATSITVRVPLAIRRRPGRKTVVTSADDMASTVRTRANPALLKALARAFRWQRMLDDGQHASISDLATAEKIERGYLGRVLQLTLLAPDVVQAIVDGRQGTELTLPTLLTEIPTMWNIAACGTMTSAAAEVAPLTWSGRPCCPAD